MTDAAYRAKYSFVLNGRLQAAATIATVALMLCIPTYMQTTQYAQTAAYCMGFAPYELWACVLLGITIPVLVLFKKLREIKDTLGESIDHC
jgi:predicted permease